MKESETLEKYNEELEENNENLRKEVADLNTEKAELAKVIKRFEVENEKREQEIMEINEDLNFYRSQF